jgi:hypothetical protein
VIEKRIRNRSKWTGAGLVASRAEKEPAPVAIKSADDFDLAPPNRQRHASTHATSVSLRVTWWDRSGENPLSLLLKGTFSEKLTAFGGTFFCG